MFGYIMLLTSLTCVDDSGCPRYHLIELVGWLGMTEYGVGFLCPDIHEIITL